MFYIAKNITGMLEYDVSQMCCCFVWGVNNLKYGHDSQWNTVIRHSQTGHIGLRDSFQMGKKPVISLEFLVLNNRSQVLSC